MDVLRGDEDSDFADLLTYLFDTINRGTIDFQVAGYLWMALNPDGDSAMQLVLRRRGAGKPIDKLARARVGHAAARTVEQAVERGVKKEAAVAEACATSGLSRSEIFSWLARRKYVIDGMPLWQESGQFSE